MTKKRTPSSKTEKAAAGAKPEAVPFQKLSRFVFLRRELRGENELPSEVARSFDDELGELVDAEFVEITEENEIQYGKLDFDFGALLEQRLRDGGLSEPNAALLARVTLQHFQGAADLNDPQQANLAVDLALALLRGVDTLSAAFNSAAELALPKEAPEKWAERDRSAGENPIEFLNRVWGNYMKAGVLYQDDIKRLGDPKLVPAIRTYCHRHPDIKAANVLPPPQRQRLDDALAAAQPGSIEEQLLRNRIHQREAVRLAKRRSRQHSP